MLLLHPLKPQLQSRIFIQKKTKSFLLSLLVLEETSVILSLNNLRYVYLLYVIELRPTNRAQRF